MKLGKPKRYTWFRNAKEKVSSDHPVIITTMANSISHNNNYHTNNLVTGMSSWLLVPKGRNFRHILATLLCVTLIYHVTLLAMPTSSSSSLSSGAAVEASSIDNNNFNEINTLPVVAAALSACESCEEDAASNPISEPRNNAAGTNEKSESHADTKQFRTVNKKIDDENNTVTNFASSYLPAETSGSNNQNSYYYTDEVRNSNNENSNDEDSRSDNHDESLMKSKTKTTKESGKNQNNDNFNDGSKSVATKEIKKRQSEKKLLNFQYQKRKKLLDSIFLSIKSTKRFHKTRLGPVLNTWFNLARDQTWIFTDDDDAELSRQTNGHIINTHCPSTHYRQALCCKMSAEFDTFIKSQKSWFCHFDDDNYVNVPALLDLLSKYDHREDWYLGKPSLKIPIKIPHPDNKSEEISFWFATGGAGFCLSRALAKRMSPVASGGKFTKLCDSIQLPDDVTIGYIAGHLLGRNLTVIPQFHSHYETMRFLDMKNPYPEITFSYVRYWDNSLNTLEIDGFTEEEDPTRFLSLHCLLFPNFSFCQKNKR